MKVKHKAASWASWKKACQYVTNRDIRAACLMIWTIFAI